MNPLHPTPSAPESLLRQFRIMPTGLELFWEDGHRQKLSYWRLRDQDSAHWHPNGQKLGTTQDWPEALHPAEVRHNQRQVYVKWSGDGHTSVFSEEELRSLTQKTGQRQGPVIWNRMLAPDMCFFELKHVLAYPEVRLQWLEVLRDYGFAGLRGVETSRDGLEEVIRQIGPIRETNFGRIFDILPRSNPRNFSDSNLALPPRTENPYRDPAPGIHALHCLRPAAEGGEILLVDGLFVLSKVKKITPQGYDLLSSIPVRFQYQDEQVWLEHERCLVELTPTGSFNSLAFNNRSVDPFSLPGSEQEAWFQAYRSLEKEILTQRNQLRITLQPGELLLINNRRVLHGQTAFPAADGRHLQGCYLEHDGLMSEIRKLRAGKSLSGS